MTRRIWWQRLITQNTIVQIGDIMDKMVCTVCGWIYDPGAGVPQKDIPPGTDWHDVPEDFRCPKCGAMKKWFQKVE